MPIDAQCSACGSEFRLREELQGKNVRCKKCGAEFKVLAEAEQQTVAVGSREDDDTEPTATQPSRRRSKKGGERPRRKKVAKEKSFRTIAGFVALIGLVVAFLVGLGFLFYFMTAKEIEQKITDSDRAAVVTADQIDPKISGVQIPPGAGTFHKIRDRYGKYILRYTYGAADESTNSFFLETIITIAPYESEAEVVYTRASGAMALGAGWEGKTVPKKIDVNKMFHWGNESRCVVLFNGKKDVGNIFVTRKGGRVFSFVLIKRGFRDGAAFQNLITPALQRMENYHP
jgi:hypothetical protein